MSSTHKTLIHKFETIYGLEKNGKIKMWQANVYEEDDIAICEIEYGYIDGKKQLVSREYTSGKNIGKKNETTPIQQCLLETTKKWTDKKEKESYSECVPDISVNTSVKKTSEKVFPMLAHKYEPHTTKKKKIDIIFPCFVQPKLDGLRCIVYKRDEKILFQSRTGTYFETMEHLEDDLHSIFKKNPDIILDGELYTFQIPFEELAGLIKKKKITSSDKEKLSLINYNIYDVIDENESFDVRFDILKNIFKNSKFKSLLLVDTLNCKDIDNFKNLFVEFVENGYEGIMLRNLLGKYKCNYRSNDLQKYKEFNEDEYEIVNYKEADGKDKGTVIWICKTKDNKEFSVRPRGTQEQRKEWFKKGDKYIGKKLTVIYQELSETNVPRFPVGKAIRDEY
jgi:DNA ligase-1